jgi:hypothetical protein
MRFLFFVLISTCFSLSYGNDSTFPVQDFRKNFLLTPSPNCNSNFQYKKQNRLPGHFRIESANDKLLRNEKASVWKKVGRAELFIGGIELAGMGILILMPKEITKWEDTWMQDAWKNLKRSFTQPPVMDKDDWAINYIGHPVAGSYYYNALRSQQASWFHSFLFSTAQSCIWEFMIEGVAERPSIQDLIITPITGSLLGEGTHQLTMRMRRNGFSFMEKVFVIVFNPMFAINNGFGPRYNPVKAKY